MNIPGTTKSAHSFNCRDSLWALFERMSKELECSIDYLVNEAMRQYAQSRDFQLPPEEVQNLLEAEGAETAPRQPISTPPARPTVPKPGTPSVAPARPASDALPRPSSLRPPPPPPPGAAQSRTPGSSGSSGPAMPRLTLIFQGRKIPVNKDQFIIGRGSKVADLTIKDENISRKHAALILHNGAFYIKDLGSTNGVEYQGKRIDSKKINEGDVFHLCNYEIHFTYES